MFILSVFRCEDVDNEVFEIALNCAFHALVSILDDENLDVTLNVKKAQINVKLVNGTTPKKFITLEQFKQLSKFAFMENGLLCNEFHHLEAFEE